MLQYFCSNRSSSTINTANSLVIIVPDLSGESMLYFACEQVRTTMATSPVDIRSGGEELHKLHFHVLPLFSLEAEKYIQEHVTCMYPLLPSMQGADSEIIAQAMAELAELYREDEATLAQEFTWMQILLERTTMIPAKEKAKIGDKLKMYDPLWEEHPRVKKIKAEAKAKLKHRFKLKRKQSSKRLKLKLRLSKQGSKRPNLRLK